MDTLSTFLETRLQTRAEDKRLRTLRNVLPGDGAFVVVDGRRLVDFGSNDYLGLSRHPALSQRAIEFTRRWGTGSGASRLLSGNIEPYDAVERKLASLKGTEAALILPTGFQANATVLPALSAEASLVACDRYCHNSLLAGAQTAGARWTRFAHADMNDLDRRLAAHSGVKWIVSESVFSMDGDRADLPSLLKVATAHGAALYLDEAHATGVLGDFGMGLSAGKPGIALAMGTFGKGCGSFGAYVACSRLMRDFLVNECAGFIYSTALPPAVLGAIDAALDLVPRMEKQRQLLLDNAERLRTRVQRLGFDTGSSSTQIVPLIVGDNTIALRLAQYLEDGGFFAPAIRPPTVPDGSARVRLSLTTEHTYEHFERLLALLRSFRAN